MTKTEAKSATCTQTGNTEYYVCSCGKWFTDSTATTEITDKDSVIIAKTQHAFTRQVADDKYIASSATCTSKATYYYSCVCGEKGTDTFEYGSALGHSYGEWINAVDATCESDGTKGHYTCSACGKYFDQNKVELSDLTVKGGHVYGEWINAVDATCESDGTKGHYTCSVCGKYFDQNKTELSDLTVKGGHDYVNGKCSRCGDKLYSQGLVFTLSDDGKYYSVSVGTCSDSDVVIPSTWQNLPVTTIADSGFKSHENIKSVKLPDSVTSIGERAFWECKNLTTVNLHDAITEIKQYAFYDCTKLTAITIPKGLTTITRGAFAGTALTEIIIPDNVETIEMEAFSGCSSAKTLTIGKGVKTIATQAFASVGITEVVIPEGVTDIMHNPFAWSNSLTTITWNAINCKSSISDTVMDELTALTTVNVGVNVVYLPDSAFISCSALTTVNWNATACTYAGTKTKPAFRVCTALTTINIGENVTSLPAYAFYGSTTAMQEITIPDSVTEIGEGAFAGCDVLKKVVIGSGLAKLNNNAIGGGRGVSIYVGSISQWCAVKFADRYANPLYDSGSLYVGGTLVDNLVIPDDVTEISAYAFFSCASITSVKVGSGVTKVGEEAFGYCKNLVSVEWYAVSVSTAGSYSAPAFSGCSNLTAATIGDGVVNVPMRLFSQCLGLKTVTVSATVKTIGSGAIDDCVALESVSVHADNTAFCSVDGVLYNKAKTKIVHAPAALKGAVTIPDEVTEIEDSAFYRRTAITKVTIGSGVKTIGEKAFSGCSELAEVTIGANVTTIGGSAFNSCSSLKEIVIPDKVTSIDDYAFYSCSSLTTVTIGTAVTSIGKNAFAYCSALTSAEFKSPDGWFVASYSTATSGYKLTLTDNAQNATYLLKYTDYWKKG